MRKDLTESGKKTEKKQQKNRTIQLFWWTGVILIQMIVVEKLDVYAMIRQDTGRMTEDWENMAMDGTEGITIRSDSFADPGSCPIPESIYTTSEGDVYRLLSWEVEAIQVPDKSFPVEREEIIGPAEGITQLPENILVEVQEGGKTEAVSCAAETDGAKERHNEVQSRRDSGCFFIVDPPNKNMSKLYHAEK